MLRYGVPSVGGETVLFGTSSSVSRSDTGAMPTALPMTRTISAMAIAASANSRRVSSDELRRWAVELIGFLCIGAWCRRRSPASSCARVARSARGFQQPCGPRRGRCRSSCQAHGWCRRSGPDWKRDRSQSALVCLESPNRGGVRPSRPKPRSGGATAPAFTA